MPVSSSISFAATPPKFLESSNIPAGISSMLIFPTGMRVCLVKMLYFCPSSHLRMIMIATEPPLINTMELIIGVGFSGFPDLNFSMNSWLYIISVEKLINNTLGPAMSTVWIVMVLKMILSNRLLSRSKHQSWNVCDLVMFRNCVNLSSSEIRYLHLICIISSFRSVMVSSFSLGIMSIRGLLETIASAPDLR